MSLENWGFSYLSLICCRSQAAVLGSYGFPHGFWHALSWDAGANLAILPINTLKWMILYWFIYISLTNSNITWHKMTNFLGPSVESILMQSRPFVPTLNRWDEESLRSHWTGTSRHPKPKPFSELQAAGQCLGCRCFGCRIWVRRILMVYHDLSSFCHMFTIKIAI